MHAESGYWRPKPDGTIEVVIAQSTGIVEVQVFFFYIFIFNFLTFMPYF